MNTIRQVRVKDWNKLKKLLMDLNAEDPPVAIELEPLIMKGPRWLEQFPKEKLGYFVVAEEDDKIIGFCYLAIPSYYKPIAYIGIAVDKKNRRTSIGSQLFYETAGWAVTQNLSYIIADIWAWNIKSLQFFEYLGFIEKTHFKDNFRGQERNKIRMVKAI